MKRIIVSFLILGATSPMFANLRIPDKGIGGDAYFNFWIAFTVMILCL